MSVPAPRPADAASPSMLAAAPAAAATAASLRGRIGFDVSSLGRPGAGIARYTAELLAALRRLDPDPVVPLAPAGLSLGSSRSPRGEGESRFAGPASRAAWTFGVLPWWLPRHGFGLFHGTGYYAPVAGPVPTVVTVHDLSVLALPETHPRARALRARALLGRIARRAAAIVVPSTFTAEEVRLWLGTPADRIHVVPEAPTGCLAGSVGPETLAAVAVRYGLEPGFYLAVGTVEPRKNLEQAVLAIDRLRKDGERAWLVVAGGFGWSFQPLLDTIQRLGLSGAVRFLGRVPDQDLRALMGLASALVYPSLYEGFGLPVVEAMAAGLPVVASRAGALEEVAGGAALLVDPLDTEALAEAMRLVRADHRLADRLRRDGLARAAAFSWDTAAQAMLEVYAIAMSLRVAIP